MLIECALCDKHSYNCYVDSVTDDFIFLVQVTVFAKSFTPDTTADISAGFIFPYACGGDPVEIRRWFKQTVERLAGLYKRPDAIEIGI